jgi:hypothetical protein
LKKAGAKLTHWFAKKEIISSFIGVKAFWDVIR